MTCNGCSLGKRLHRFSHVTTFASALVVLFSVMCPGELIILKETKAILFAVSQDANLFWLVIQLWGLFAAARGITAPLWRSLLSCLSMCESDAHSSPKRPIQTRTWFPDENTHDLARSQATFWPAAVFGTGECVGEWFCLTDIKRGHFCPKGCSLQCQCPHILCMLLVFGQILIFFSFLFFPKFGFEENNIVHCGGYYLCVMQWLTQFFPWAKYRWMPLFWTILILNLISNSLVIPSSTAGTDITAPVTLWCHTGGGCNVSNTHRVQFNATQTPPHTWPLASQWSSTNMTWHNVTYVM